MRMSAVAQRASRVCGRGCESRRSRSRWREQRRFCDRGSMRHTRSVMSCRPAQARVRPSRQQRPSSSSDRARDCTSPPGHRRSRASWNTGSGMIKSLPRTERAGHLRYSFDKCNHFLRTEAGRCRCSNSATFVRCCEASARSISMNFRSSLAVTTMQRARRALATEKLCRIRMSK